jgi:UDP-N-acetylmuramate--alanine ligase
MFNKKAHIHFVGIGGIGMSGIATILRNQGYTISGCDQDLEQMSIQNLLAIGCTIFEGNNSAGCLDHGIEVVVYSSAIRATNPEILAAQKRGIPTIPRALMLAELMRTKYSIAIAGSHGKTTTTSLISHILIEAKYDPTVIIGGHLKTISNNARHGKGDFLVAEADESDRSFLHLHATLAVVTNIDLEHLETYNCLNDVKQTFVQFLGNLPFYGRAILCADDDNIRSILPLPHIKTILYGLDPDADFYATNIDLQSDHSFFTLHRKNSPESLGTIRINMPGEHNVLNALAAIALCFELNVALEDISRALANFNGVDRRFTYRGMFQGAEIFDDYGHHPKEIACTLKVARRRTAGKLTVVFQPHRFTRTHKLWHSFVETFANSDIDELIITDIYAASEDPIEGVTSKKLVEAIARRNPRCTISYIPYEPSLAELKVAVSANPTDLLLLLGAGSVNKLAQKLIL